jgi:hypothetical protein
MAKQPKYVVKQYSGLDPKFVAYHSKPMSHEAAYEHLSEMRGAAQASGQSEDAKWKVESVAPDRSKEF